MNISTSLEETKKIKVLLDMDGVIANFAGKIFDMLKIRRNEKGKEMHLEFAKQDEFFTVNYIGNHLGEEAKEDAVNIKNEPGFFLALDPLPRAIEKVKELIKRYDVYFLTDPLDSNPTCETDKLQRIAKYFWEEMTERVLFAKDKSEIIGNVLIDDHPHPRNEEKATRKHIIFDQPYNREGEDKPRIHWRDDPNLFEIIEKTAQWSNHP